MDEAKAVADAAVEFIAAHPNRHGGFGLSPHAPYTVSGELYRLSARYAHARNIPLTTHVAESEEEDDMIRRGTGTRYVIIFPHSGRDMSDCKRAGRFNCCPSTVCWGGCIAAHANCLTPLDLTL